MSVAFVEDLSPFFDPETPGVFLATINGRSVYGSLELAYAEPLGNAVEGSAPVFICAAADLPTVAHDDTLVIGAVTYKVCGVEPDGTGLVVLRLEKQ